ncbi:MAG: hypothetical protein IKH54_05105 [Bacilli bacterium]|nr:hypothetical protein [Bacilli bacterium]
MNKKTILLTILIICFFLLGLLIGSNTRKMTTKTRIIKEEVKEETKKLEDIRKYENIVFLGDSITDYYPFEDIYLDLPIINSGRAGYKTTDILKEMDTLVYQYNPTSVFILIGTNDFITETGDGQEKEVEDNIVKIVNNIKKHRKNTKIYIQSIYPVNKSVNENSVADRDNEEIQEVNKFLKTYCEENKYTYIDMYKYLVDEDGNLMKKYTNDGLHANEIGYARISQKLLEYLYNIEV